MRATGSPPPSPLGPPPIDYVTYEQRSARRIRRRRLLLVGLGLLLVALAVIIVFSPVTTKESEPSCGDRAAVMVAFGSPTDSSVDASDRRWCRQEASDQVVGSLVLFGATGALILAWQAGRAVQARRPRKAPPPDAAGIEYQANDLHAGVADAVSAPVVPRPDIADVAGTREALDPEYPNRMLPGRLVATNNCTWLILEDGPDHSILLIPGKAWRLPPESREFEVAGDMGRRVTCRAAGADTKFTARPDRLDRLHFWWTTRPSRPLGPAPAAGSHGPSGQPSTAAGAPPPQPDPHAPAWAHPPARRRIRRALRSAGLMLAAALLLAIVLVWADVTDQDWFWQDVEESPDGGIPVDEVVVLGMGFFVAIGASGIGRYRQRRHILHRQPWELADIMSPEIRRVVLRQHNGPLGPVTCTMARTLALHAHIRILACRQLWFAMGDRGTLLAATPDFRTIVELRPEEQ